MYTGITNNLSKRVEKHNKGNGAKSLLGKRPVTLVYSEEVSSKSAALKREYEIKQWSREKKRTLLDM